MYNCFRWAFFISMLFATTFLTGQTIQVKIIDGISREPVVGAAITVGDSAFGVSDLQGFYAFEKPIDSITVRHVAYENFIYRFADSEKRFHTIVLFPKVNPIDAIIVRPSGAIRTQIELPQAVSSIDLRQSGKLASSNLNEQLNMVSGVSGFTGTQNTNRIVIRGIGARTPYGSNRVAAYLDNIPLANGNGYVAPEEFDPEYVSQIQVLKGGASAIYGSGLGGAILIHALPYTNRSFEARAGMDYASFNHTHYYGNLSGQQNNYRWGIFGSYSKSDGYRENNNFERFNLGYKTSLIRTRFSMELCLYGLSGYAQIPSSIDEDTYIHHPERAAQNWKNVQGNEAADKVLTSLSATWLIGRYAKINSVIYGTYSSTKEVRPFNNESIKSLLTGSKFVYSYERKRYYSQYLAESRLEEGHYLAIEPETGMVGEDITNSSSSQSIRIVQGFRPFQNLWTEANIAVSKLDYSYEANNYYDYKYQPFSISFSPMLSIGWHPIEFASVYMNLSNGISYPTSEDVYYSNWYLDNSLKPESGWNKEVGLKLQTTEKRFATQLSYYHLDVKDMLVVERLNDIDYLPKNAGEARHAGIEHELQLNWPVHSSRWFSEVQFKAAQSFSQHRFTKFIDSDDDFSGNAIPGVPNYQASVYASARTDYQMGCSFTYLYSGRQYMNDENTQQYPGHQLLHGKVFWDFQSKKSFTLHLYLAVNNIPDRRYASMILVNAPSFGGEAPRYYYPGEPRNYKVGVKISF